MKRTILAIFVLLLTVLIITVFFSYRTFRRSLPQTKGHIEIQTLQDNVQIYRDKNGVPHIFASNDHDLYFAQGYTIAQDRLWQLELIRRMVNGRLSEILGDTTVAVDQLMLTIGFKRIAGDLYKKISERSKSVVRAYTDGINSFIRTNPEKLPVEFMLLDFQPGLWNPEDCLAFSRLMGWELSLSWYVEWVAATLKKKIGIQYTNELFADDLSQWPIIGSGKLSDFDFSILRHITCQLNRISGIENWPKGSNNWVISGLKAENGKPMLANDPHLPLVNPSSWYMAHLMAPGINSAGFSMPGSPGIAIGFNQKIAWGFTNAMIDDADFFVEQIDTSDSTRYFANGQWRKMNRYDEVIPIEGEEAKRIKIYSTNHGPVINAVHPRLKKVTQKVSFRWTGQDYSDETDAFYRLNRAQDWRDFQSAVRKLKVPGQNIVYCDTQGNIGYWSCGRIPIRANPTVNQGQQEWIGFIPFAELPHAFNPQKGFLATANNRIAPKDYPYYISNLWEPPSRILRINQLLSGDKKLSVANFKAMQMDTFSPFAQFLAPRILPELKKLAGGDEAFRRIYQFLQGWDFYMRGESVAATIFQVFLQTLLDNTFKDELGEESFHDYLFFSGFSYRALRKIFTRRLYHWFDDVTTKNKRETPADIIQKSWRQTKDKLIRRMGDDPIKWRWDRLHRVTFRHFLGDQPLMSKIFNIGPFPMGGSNTTIDNGYYNFTKPYDCIVGPSMRMIVDMANPGRAEVINPPGQVGHPLSSHYRDQTEFWLNGLYLTLETDTTLIRNSNFDLLELTVPKQTKR